MEAQDYFDTQARSYWGDGYEREVSNHHHLLLQQRRQLVRELLPNRTDAVLEVGCGPGIFRNDIDASRYVVADLSYRMVCTAKQRAGSRETSGVQLSAEALPFADESFDLVLAVGVLDYVPEVGKALQELARVLPEGGALIATFPSPQPFGNALRRIGRPIEPMARRLLRRELAAHQSAAPPLHRNAPWHFEAERWFQEACFEPMTRHSFHFFYFPFDALWFSLAARADRALERAGRRFGPIAMLAQSSVWLLKKA